MVLTSRHASSQIWLHETSKSHILAANIYMQLDSSKTVDTLLSHEQTVLRAPQVKNNQEVVKRLIDWILCIGRQGLAYRESEEAIKNFTDTSESREFFGNITDCQFT